MNSEGSTHVTHSQWTLGRLGSFWELTGNSAAELCLELLNLERKENNNFKHLTLEGTDHS